MCGRGRDVECSRLEEQGLSILSYSVLFLCRLQRVSVEYLMKFFATVQSPDCFHFTSVVISIISSIVY
jgi:hypothetical protein